MRPPPMLFAALIAALIAVAGCGVTDPFEYRADAFNRASPTFNRDPDPFTEVSFCYVGWQTPIETVNAMAEDRCGAFGRRARFRAFSYDQCPALTPVLAAYDCIAP